MGYGLSVDLRERVVAAYETEQGSYAKIAVIFGVGLSSVKRWVAAKRETGSLAPKPVAANRPPKIGPEHWDDVRAIIDAKNHITQRELCVEIKHRLNIEVSQSMVCELLKRMGITYKKKTQQASERNTERVQKLREEIVETFATIQDSQLVFIDESGSNTQMTPRYGYSSKGERAYGEMPKRSYCKNVTMLGALALDGMRTQMTVDGGTTGEVFIAFVEQCLVPVLNPGDVVVMDNFSSHKVKGVREAIEGCGAQVLYLPPYSPELNAIENAWSKIKNVMRKNFPRSRDELDAAFIKGLEEIHDKDIRGWFRHFRRELRAIKNKVKDKAKNMIKSTKLYAVLD